jgi:hypothetical protein
MAHSMLLFDRNSNARVTLGIAFAPTYQNNFLTSAQRLFCSLINPQNLSMSHRQATNTALMDHRRATDRAHVIGELHTRH